MIANSIPLIVEKIVEETKRAKSFFIKRKDGLPLEYKPGQFLHFAFKQINELTYRSYSLSTIPEEGAAITVKSMENGNISRAIQNIQKGSTLNLINVGGKFVLPNNLSEINQVYLFAAGSGITPIFSILKQILLHHPHITVNLYYSNSSVSNTIFYTQIQLLAKKYSQQFKVKYLFSNSNNILEARLSGFLLQKYVNESLNSSWNNVLAYCCGPVEYMDTIKITLFTEGIKAVNFFMEYFDTASEDLMTPPSDQAMHKVNIIFKEKVHQINVQYPDTILTAGLNAGLTLPYSCRSGQCGSCTAKVIDGEVWLQYNEVLTPDDISHGLTLSCMACPINGNVTISYDR